MTDPRNATDEKNRTSADPHRRWLGNNPGALPSHVEEEAGVFGMDLSDPKQIAAIRELLDMDPDMFGDFDAFE